MKTEKYAKPGYHPNSIEQVSAARKARGGTRTRLCTHPDRQRRQQGAQERQAEYDKLSLHQKLERALERGHEGTREVKRLKAQLEAA